ncbi:hypothetical protein D3C74_213610 [compost metagenome]
MRCKMPKCRGVADKNWSMVPVCNSCYNDISKDTRLYYSQKIQSIDRILHIQLKKVKEYELR